MITIAHCLVHPAHIFYAFADSEITIVQFHLKLNSNSLSNIEITQSITHRKTQYYSHVICITCKCVNPVMLSVIYFNHWLRIALSSQCITPVRAPLSPLTSNAFLLSLSVPNIYLVTYAIINGTEKCHINYYVPQSVPIFTFRI